VSRLVDVDGAAEHLSVSPRFVRRLIAQRRVPYLKVGKFVRFDMADLDAWLEACRVESVTYDDS
jgi:excisionase family DNA binding protein